MCPNFHYFMCPNSNWIASKIKQEKKQKTEQNVYKPVFKHFLNIWHTV